MTAKTFERTYEIDTEGAPFGTLSPAQMGGLTRRLRAEAKKEGITGLGDTHVVNSTGNIGGILAVTCRATVDGTSDDADTTEAENLVADLDAPAEA